MSLPLLLVLILPVAAIRDSQHGGRSAHSVRRAPTSALAPDRRVLEQTSDKSRAPFNPSGHLEVHNEARGPVAPGRGHGTLK